MLPAYFVFRTATVIVVLSFSRMQKLAQEQNEKIEKVNRERKYHQVIIIYHLLSVLTCQISANLLFLKLLSAKHCL